MACVATLAAAFRRVAFAGALALGATTAGADEPILLRVNAFPNAKALPLHAGIAEGIFTKRGLTIELHLTENSRSQRDGLAAGKFDVVHSAVDNALAMIEVGKHDVVIVTGGDSGMNEFFVQPEIKSFADLRGRTLVVDAPDTGNCLVHDPADSARAAPALCAAAEAAVDLAGGARRTFGAECRPHIVIGQHVARADDHGNPAFQPV
jgi:ABC-type nitrate/sulfonate/bicarbonate transport system substrate-binding protein